ncbi:hypothetical protein ARTHRO8AJ_440194 [Arthrobacter sp. 8AJ]|nr:hypothetical protein ARTHRO8AJ_440194 [Arthrobacter sp. 8AJ]
MVRILQPQALGRGQVLAGLGAGGGRRAGRAARGGHGLGAALVRFGRQRLPRAGGLLERRRLAGRNPGNYNVVFGWHVSISPQLMVLASASAKAKLA